MSYEREINKWLTTPNKVLILFVILFVFLSVFIPLFQRAAKHDLETKIKMSEERVLVLEDQTRILESEIAIAKSPEALIQRSVRKLVTYEELDNKSILLPSTEGILNFHLKSFPF